MKTVYSILITLILVFLIGGGIYFYNLKKTTISPQQKISTLSDAKKSFDKNDFKSVYEILDEKLATNNSDIDTLLAKATALAQEASLNFKEKVLGEEARNYVNKALKLDPAYSPSYLLLGYTYEIQEDYNKAHAAYDQAISLDPKNALAYSQKAHAYDLEGDFKDAKIYYEKALAIDSTDPKILSGYGRILIITGDIEKAKTIYEKIIDSPNNRLAAEAYYTLGSLNEKSTYNEISEDYYTNAISKDSTLPMAFVGLAKEQFKKSLETKDKTESQKLVDSSFVNLEIALKLNPNQSYASLQLAIQSMTIGNKEFALKVLDRLSKNTFNDITLNKQDRENLQAIALNMITTINKGK